MSGISFELYSNLYLLLYVSPTLFSPSSVLWLVVCRMLVIAVIRVVTTLSFSGQTVLQSMFRCVCVYYTRLFCRPYSSIINTLLSSPTLSLPHSASLPASQGATGRSSGPAKGASSAPHPANFERSCVFSSSIPGPSPGRHPHTQELASKGTGPRLPSQDTQLVSLC